MALTHSPSARDALCNAVVDLVDTGSALPNGRLQLAVDSGFTDVLVAINLQNPAFSASTGGAGAAGLVLPPEGASAVYAGLTTKTVNYFRFVNRDGVEVLRGTVSGPSGSGDIRLADNVVPPDTTLTILSYVYNTIA